MSQSDPPSVRQLSIFDRSGVAALDDLQEQSYTELFSRLEAKQAEFLAAQPKFRSAGYRWPKDALHNWSRIWEYPYVYHHLQRYANTRQGRPLRAADIGSGVTFMPFAVADLGYEVCCVDTDPIVGTDLGRAVNALGYRPDQIYYRATDGRRLPLDDHSLDCLFCISVLEHVPDPSSLVQEFRRVLKPDGLLLLTIDLALNQYAEIAPPNHARLLSQLEREFQLVHPFGSMHPARILTSRNGPLRLFNLTLDWRRILIRTYHSFWQTLGRDREPLLACEGFVLKPNTKAA